jgi:type II secretory pathway component GspD/PulD (secretin)
MQWSLLARKFASLSGIFLLACSASVVTAQIAQKGQPAATQASAQNQQVDLKLDNVDIKAALKSLFQQTGLNYTIENDVKGTVTANFTGVPFRNALDMLIRSANDRLTYRVEAGVYRIQLRPEGPAPDPIHEDIRPEKITLYFASGADIVQVITAKPTPLLPSGIVSIVSHKDDNSIIATGKADDIRQLKMLIRLLDIAPKQVGIRAELILNVTGKSGKGKNTIIDSNGRTATDRPLYLKTVLGNNGAASEGIKIESGHNTVKVHPRINGDASISLAVDWDVDVYCRINGSPNTIHLKRSYSGNLRVANGSTVELSGNVLKLDGASKGPDTELLLFITPSILPDPMENPGPGAIINEKKHTASSATVKGRVLKP